MFDYPGNPQNWASDLKVTNPMLLPRTDWKEWERREAWVAAVPSRNQHVWRESTASEPEVRPSAATAEADARVGFTPWGPAQPMFSSLLTKSVSNSDPIQ